jgi:hypothetical protein
MGALPQETPLKLLPEKDGEGEVEAQPTIHYVDHLRGAWARCRKKLHYILPEEDGEGEVEAEPAIYYVDHLCGAWARCRK